MDERSSKEVPGGAFEVAFATPTRQVIVTLLSSETLSAREAVWQAGLESRFEEYSAEFFRSAPLGCFGERLRDPEHYTPRAGDRIEVYRGLEIDPKQARRERAAKAD